MMCLLSLRKIAIANEPENTQGTAEARADIRVDLFLDSRFPIRSISIVNLRTHVIFTARFSASMALVPGHDVA